MLASVMPCGAYLLLDRHVEQATNMLRSFFVFERPLIILYSGLGFYFPSYFVVDFKFFQIRLNTSNHSIFPRSFNSINSFGTRDALCANPSPPAIIKTSARIILSRAIADTDTNLLRRHYSLVLS